MPEQINGFKVHIAEGEAALFADLARSITALANRYIAQNGIFSIALAGGNTPRALYTNLAKLPEGEFPWAKTFLFLGDERCVSHDNGDSNYKMISESLLSRISIPSTNVFPTTNQQKDPEESAKRYEQTIKRFFKLESDDQNISWPRFSLVLLGLGADGHTASLFPDSPALSEEKRLFMPNRDRLTITKNVIGHAGNVFFIVTGAAKAPVVDQIFTQPDLHLPAQVVANACKKESVEWFIDEAAASQVMSK